MGMPQERFQGLRSGKAGAKIAFDLPIRRWPSIAAPNSSCSTLTRRIWTQRRMWFCMRTLPRCCRVWSSCDGLTRGKGVGSGLPFDHSLVDYLLHFFLKKGLNQQRATAIFEILQMRLADHITGRENQTVDRFRVVVLQVLVELIPIALRHLQVAENQIVVLAGNFLESLLAGGSRVGLMPEIVQRIDQELQQGRLVIHHQYCLGFHWGSAGWGAELRRGLVLREDGELDRESRSLAGSQ